DVGQASRDRGSRARALPAADRGRPLRGAIPGRAALSGGAVAKIAAGKPLLRAAFIGCGRLCRRDSPIGGRSRLESRSYGLRSAGVGAFAGATLDSARENGGGPGGPPPRASE